MTKNGSGAIQRRNNDEIFGLLSLLIFVMQIFLLLLTPPQVKIPKNVSP